MWLCCTCSHRASGHFSVDTIITNLKAAPQHPAPMLGTYYLANTSGKTREEHLVLLAHDSVDELVLVQDTITILVGPVHHLLKFVVCHVLPELLAHTFQILEGDGTSLVIIEQLENLEEILASVFALL